MKNTIIGYPRVGAKRELKFWTEDYFKGNISEEELEKRAQTLRKTQWQIIKEENIDYIPCNDFSFYDGMLDTAMMLNVIPKCYKALNLTPLATYFAMARGYQGEAGDVKARPMKKWFNTNYHYIVPYIEEDVAFKLNSTKLIRECKEAQEIGIQAKPVVIGGFTFLKLSEYDEKIKVDNLLEQVAELYCQLIEELELLNVKWLQIDEPILVTDLNKEDQENFRRFYNVILKRKGRVKIALQTYFGDLRDCYQEIIALGFDGIGIDFVEGRKSVELIESYGFPKDTQLFAGVVNGKNIWRNDYKQSLELLERLKGYVKDECLVINTSCSLLHVPYSLKYEQKLSEAYKKYFAYAEEKLQELKELRYLAEKSEVAQEVIYSTNQQLFKERHRERGIKAISLNEEDFIRKPAFEIREKIQREVFNLPVLPTTTIGSFPQTKEIKHNRSQFKKGEITEEVYSEVLKKKIQECIAHQEQIGLDVLVHGEYERNDMVEYFGEHLQGYLFTENGWVQSYGTRCVKPPVIWGDISRTDAITVAYTTYAQSLTNKPVKGMLTGPVTILNWSFPREDISLKEMAYQIALAMREEVLELEANGICIIQIDEAALKEKLPLRKEDWYSEYLDWAIKAFRLVHSGVKETTQIHTHMCYSEFESIIKAIDDMDADVISFEASRSNLSIIRALNESHFKMQVGPGVYDIHSPRVPSKEELIGVIQRLLKEIKIEKLWINPDCGLKTRDEEEIVPSLINLVQATESVRGNLNKLV